MNIVQCPLRRHKPISIGCSGVPVTKPSELGPQNSNYENENASALFLTKLHPLLNLSMDKHKTPGKASAAVSRRKAQSKSAASTHWSAGLHPAGGSATHRRRKHKHASRGPNQHGKTVNAGLGIVAMPLKPRLGQCVGKHSN